MLGFGWSVPAFRPTVAIHWPESTFMALRILLTAALALALGSGCGGKAEKSTPGLDASELLALFQEKHQVDAKNFVEVDMGRFRVVHSLGVNEGQLYVQFHLFGILPVDRQSRVTEKWPLYEKRARDAVISLVQATETEHLTDPSLAFFKEEIATTVNRVLQERIILDVVFSDFSMDREPGMPWSAPAGEAKPKEKGHGGGHGGGGHGGGHGH